MTCSGASSDFKRLTKRENATVRGVVSAYCKVCDKPQGITLTYIQPGKPQQNAYVERYNRTVRHEWLDLYIFETIEEVQQIATEWLWTYNNERPNMGIGGVTPAMKLKMAA